MKQIIGAAALVLLFGSIVFMILGRLQGGDKSRRGFSNFRRLEKIALLAGIGYAIVRECLVR